MNCLKLGYCNLQEKVIKYRNSPFFHKGRFGMTKKVKIMSIFGTRPEAVKMAPLVAELEKDSSIESFVCVTAQHREMLDQVLDIFGITPDFDCNIMRQDQELSDIAIEVLKGFSPILKEVKPDLVLVHGDTLTSFAAALASFYNQVKVGHVEAGLRTGDKYQPYPEELNRVLNGHIADLHFAPTLQSKENLLREGISKNIFVTGNTAIDSIKYTVKENYIFKEDILNKLDYDNKKIILLTAHRRENLGEPLENICKAVLQIINEFEDVEIVYPVHLNPKVQQTVRSILGEKKRTQLIAPINIEEMHNLMAKVYLIATDSGGLQEEAPFFNKPTIVLRNVTERPEGLQTGCLKLGGNDQESVYNAIKTLITNKNEYEKMANAPNPFGDGHSSDRIVEAIKYHFNITKDLPKEYTY